MAVTLGAIKALFHLVTGGSPNPAGPSHRFHSILEVLEPQGTHT